MTDASLAPPRKITLDDLRGESHRMRKEAIVKVVFLAAAVVSIVISALIIFSLVREAWTFMSKVEWKTLWSEGWFPRRNLFDVKTLFVGTLLTTAVAMVVATPSGWAPPSTCPSTPTPGCARCSSRCSRSSPASRASCSASSP